METRNEKQPNGQLRLFLNDGYANWSAQFKRLRKFEDSYCSCLPVKCSVRALQPRSQIQWEKPWERGSFFLAGVAGVRKGRGRARDHARGRREEVEAEIDVSSF